MHISKNVREPMKACFQCAKASTRNALFRTGLDENYLILTKTNNILMKQIILKVFVKKPHFYP